MGVGWVVVVVVCVWRQSAGDRLCARCVCCVCVGGVDQLCCSYGVLPCMEVSNDLLEDSRTKFYAKDYSRIIQIG
jgi:hypothetical protein